MSRREPKTKPLTERFWAKVNKDGPTMPHMDTPCWVWTASKFKSGYGVFCGFGRRSDGAHRSAWIIAHGFVASGMFVCHRCDNPPCVRADHLFLGTPLDNTRDMAQKGRRKLTRWASNVHSRSVLNPERVIDIRRRYSEGEDTRDIAARFGVSRASVYTILNGARWGHIPGGIISSEP